MVKLNITPEAIQDALEIKNYISQELKSPQAAQNLSEKFAKAIRNLQQFPDSGAPLSSIINFKSNYRFIVCNNYLIFYRHEGEIVLVSRIIYAGRDFAQILFGGGNCLD